MIHIFDFLLYTFLLILAGALHGLRETLVTHYGRFDIKFPDTNPEFWNPTVSWAVTKTILGYKFDAYHIFESLKQLVLIFAGYFLRNARIEEFENFSNSGAINYLINLGVLLIWGFVFYSGGNILIYDIIFPKEKSQTM